MYKILILKVECNPDIHMLSVNREGQEDLTVKKLSKIGQSVSELWIFEVLVNPYYGHLQVGNSDRICDVIVDKISIEYMYRKFHFFLIFIRNNISSGALF